MNRESKYAAMYKPLGNLPLHTLDSEDRTSVCQEWVERLPLRMQSVLFSCVRGPDGVAKHGGAKLLTRWFRRCILVTSHDRRIYHNPWEYGGGGSFMRQWDPDSDPIKEYLDVIDVLPHHYQMHFLHATQILGHRHPTPEIAEFWGRLYDLLVEDLHLSPETEERFEERFADDPAGWDAHIRESHLR